jgi:hypothetical protein
LIEIFFKCRTMHDLIFGNPLIGMMTNMENEA